MRRPLDLEGDAAAGVDGVDQARQRDGVVGTGDPAPGDLKLARQNGGGTTTTILDQWAEALKAKGVERVKGNLYYYFHNKEEILFACPQYSLDRLMALMEGRDPGS